MFSQAVASCSSSVHQTGHRTDLKSERGTDSTKGSEGQMGGMWSILGRHSEAQRDSQVTATSGDAGSWNPLGSQRRIPGGASSGLPQ